MPASIPDSPPRPAASARPAPRAADPASSSVRRRREASGDSDGPSDPARKRAKAAAHDSPSAPPRAANRRLPDDPVADHERPHDSVEMVNSPVRQGGELPTSIEARTNGHSAMTTNGHSNGNVPSDVDGPHSNGSADPPAGSTVSTYVRPLDAGEYEGDEGFVPLWAGSNLDRREFVRLAMQTFEDMGYTCVALDSLYSHASIWLI